MFTLEQGILWPSDVPSWQSCGHWPLAGGSGSLLHTGDSSLLSLVGAGCSNFSSTS